MTSTWPLAMGRRRGQSTSQTQGGDTHERRKIQNRIAQRHYRERQKQCLETARKVLLAHEALQNRCHVTVQCSHGHDHGSPLDHPFGDHAQPARNTEEAAPGEVVVPLDIQQALMRFESSERHVYGKYATTSFDSPGSFEATGGDLTEPARQQQQVRDITMSGRNDTTCIHVSTNEALAGEGSASRQVEVVEPFTPVSPGDFFEFPSPSCSDALEPLLSTGTGTSAESPSMFGTLADALTSPRPVTSRSSHGEAQTETETESGSPTVPANQSQLTLSRLSSDVENRREVGGVAGSGTPGHHHHHQPPVVGDDEWSTPLLAAIARGHVQMVRLFVQNGADLETRSKSGRTGLWWAVEMRQMETLRCCLELGADLGALEDDSGLGLLHRSIVDGDVALLKVLLESCEKLGDKGREWIHAPDRQNRTPLYLAAEMGNTEMAELLIKAGADINRR